MPDQLINTGQLAHCTQLLRESRYDLYLSTLYLPPKPRELALVLWAFASQINKVPFIVNEPTLGEMRFQWWRDVLLGQANSTGDPLAEALMAHVEDGNVEAATLDNFLKAKIFDLYHDPMPDIPTFEAYHGECVSVFFAATARQAVEAIKVNMTTLVDACGHAGVYCGTIDAWTALPQTRAQAKQIMPAAFNPDESDSTSKVWQQNLNQFLDMHFEKAIAAIADLPEETRAIFLPMATARQRHGQRRKSDFNIKKPLPELSRLALNWQLWRSARKLAKGSSLS